MCDLSIDINNIHGWKNRAEIDVGNSIEYDVKSYQVKKNYSKFYQSTTEMIEA